MIGVSALVVPTELIWGHRLLESMADRAAIASATYDTISGLCLALTMIPWCACMGATIPVAMFAIRQRQQKSDSRSFSFLYLANVLGAMLGSFLPLLLIEPYGFHRTLRIGAILNATIAIAALLVSLARRKTESTIAAPADPVYAPTENNKSILVLLFTTGLATMGMELIWIRMFTPYVGPVVYSFGMILVAYLLATFIGSRIYRIWSRKQKLESRLTWISLALLGNASATHRRLSRPYPPRGPRFLGVMPFAGMIGFLTPMLVDRWSGGDPDRAGSAYAVDVVGCIVGPLICGYLLLPLVGERWSASLAGPAVVCHGASHSTHGQRPNRLTAHGLRAAAVGAGCLFLEPRISRLSSLSRQVRRDSTATVIAQAKV